MTRRAPLPLLLLAVLASLVLPRPAAAWQDGDVIKEIRVEGNDKVESEAVLDIMSMREGQLLRRSTVAQAIKDIHRLRWFEDIRVEAEDVEGGVRLIVRVREKPAIRDVQLEGNKKVTADDIKEVLTLKAYSILDMAKVRENVGKIEDLYLEKGFFLADVRPEVERGPANEVYVKFVIREGKKVLVKRIDLVGNEAFKDEEIKRFMQTKGAGIFPGAGETGTYRREVLDGDVEIIEYLYGSKGYLDVEVSRPEVSLSPDKRWVNVTIHIVEGEPYTVGRIELKGDLIADEDELRALLKTKEGETFNRIELGEDVQRLVGRYSDDGYAFANVIPLPRQDREARTVDLTFDFQKGEVIYLEDIVITGNLDTWDKTIRREIGIAEGDRWSGKEIERARRRLTRLGYFEDGGINITTPRGDEPNTLDMAIDVVEKPTGTFSLGAGFSTIESFVFTANVSRANFLGLGYTMAFSANLSLGRDIVRRGFFQGENSRQELSFQLYDPYFLDTRWTASISAFLRNQTVLLTQFSRGLNLGLGHYIGKDDDAQVSLQYAVESVGLTALRPSQRQAFGGNLYRDGTKSSLQASIILDKRDNRISPTKGIYATAGLEFAGGFKLPGQKKVIKLLGGDFNFLRLRTNLRVFYPLGTPLLVFRYNLSFGWITSLDGTIVPYTERFQAGGPYSVRGYTPLSLGPRIRHIVNSDPVHAADSIPVGGTMSLINNVEIEFPIIPPAQVRGVVFFDAGSAFGGLYGTEPLRLEDLRFSAGFGVRWNSPMGPLRFEWGFPIDRRPGERGQVFEFAVGSFF